MDDKQKQSMGELAALMYEDADFKVPAEMPLKQAMDLYAETRFPGTQARIAAQRVTQQGAAEIAKQRDEFKKEIEAERAARVRERAIETIKSDPKLRITDEEIKDVEKVMAERYIGTYEDAATVYRDKLKPLQVAAPRRSSRSMDLPGTAGAGTEFDWLKPAWATRDGAVLDKVANRKAQDLLDEYDRDPVGFLQKYPNG